ncbi:alpha/beta fold hydrolase [Nocardia sp. NBC_01327]|uniref:alpha/beta fold hydrolase n=1 Tax=Nocardia sp. NBC_01327 TaxID=2903593 RepID=UPI002E0EF37E|nr:alpha/beta hydrolase [Nocardia sp. NBC_01327]
MTAILDAPGAQIYYKVRGTGPVLLLLPGGDGDADAFDGLAHHLEPDFTVVTFDRRGLSRSTATTAAASPRTHADDAALVLAALTDSPALVFGTSIGAVIAMELAVRHQERVRIVVAHEPPVGALLPDAERTELVQAQLDVEDAYRRDGIAAAMMLFVRIAGFDIADREPDVPLAPLNPCRIRNLEYFLAHDVPAVREYHPDTVALRAVADSIMPAVGETSVGPVPRCSSVLAQLLRSEIATFPGGHNGPSFRPRAFADRLREILRSIPCAA